MSQSNKTSFEAAVDTIINDAVNEWKPKFLYKINVINDSLPGIIVSVLKPWIDNLNNMDSTRRTNSYYMSHLPKSDQTDLIKIQYQWSTFMEEANVIHELSTHAKGRELDKLRKSFTYYYGNHNGKWDQKTIFPKILDHCKHVATRIGDFVEKNFLINSTVVSGRYHSIINGAIVKLVEMQTLIGFMTLQYCAPSTPKLSNLLKYTSYDRQQMSWLINEGRMDFKFLLDITEADEECLDCAVGLKEPKIWMHKLCSKSICNSCYRYKSSQKSNSNCRHCQGPVSNGDVYEEISNDFPTFEPETNKQQRLENITNICKLISAVGGLLERHLQIQLGIPGIFFNKDVHIAALQSEKVVILQRMIKMDRDMQTLRNKYNQLKQRYDYMQETQQSRNCYHYQYEHNYTQSNNQYHVPTAVTQNYNYNAEMPTTLNYNCNNNLNNGNVTNTEMHNDDIEMKQSDYTSTSNNYNNNYEAQTMPNNNQQWHNSDISPDNILLQPLPPLPPQPLPPNQNVWYSQQK